MVSRIIGVFAALLLAASPAAAQSLTDEAARDFASSLVLQLSGIAGDESLSEDDRVTRLRDAMRESMALGPIGRFILGSNGRDMATEEEMARYEALFPDFIATKFAEDVGEIAERDIIIDNVVRRRDNEVIVESRLIGDDGEEAADVAWRIRLEEDEPRLLDVLVERISPMLTQREEIGAIVEAEGMTGLLAHMEAVIARTTE
jgi:ABC-type transporter MlaC component